MRHTTSSHETLHSRGFALDLVSGDDTNGGVATSLGSAIWDLEQSADMVGQSFGGRSVRKGQSGGFALDVAGLCLALGG